MHKIFHFYEFFLIENTKYGFVYNLTWGRLVPIMTGAASCIQISALAFNISKY